MTGQGLFFGGRCLLALTLTAATALSGMPARARAAETGGDSAPAAPANASYESLAHGAVKTQDVATLLAPFVDSCGGEMGDLDRARCRTSRRKAPAASP